MALAVLVIVATTFVVAWPSGVGISWDLYAYLTSAGILNQGGGFTSLGRPDIARSGFVAMLAGLQRLGLESVDGIFVFLTLWAAALVGASFLLAWRLFGLAAGIVTALLLLASTDFMAALPRHVDHVWPTLLLVAAILLYSPSRSPTTGVAIMAGVLTGFAITVKETAAVFLALPLLLVFFGYYRGRWIIGFYAAAGLFLAGWFGLAAAVAPPPGTLTNVATLTDGVPGEIASEAWYDSLRNHVSGALGKAADQRIASLDGAGVVESFWRIHDDFPLLLLTIPALIALCISWVRGRSPAEPIRFLAAMSIVGAPLFLLTVVADLRLGQALIVPIVGAVWLAAASILIAGRWGNRAGAAFAGLLVTTTALASTPPDWRWPWFQSALGSHDDRAFAQARLVRDHVPKGSVLFQWLGAGPYLTPFLTREVSHKALPLWVVGPSACRFASDTSDVISAPISVGPGSPPRLFTALPEQLSIPDAAAARGVYAMIRADPEFMLDRWLQAHPQAELVHRGGEGRAQIAIYRLEQPFKPSLGEPTLRIDKRFIADADANLLPETYSWRWDDQRRNAYRDWVNACLKAEPTLTGTDFDWKAGR